MNSYENMLFGFSTKNQPIRNHILNILTIYFPIFQENEIRLITGGLVKYKNYKTLITSYFVVSAS